MNFPRNLRIETSFLSRRSQSQPPPQLPEQEGEDPAAVDDEPARTVEEQLDGPFSPPPPHLSPAEESLSGRYYSDISGPDGLSTHRISKYSDHEYEPIGEPVTSVPDFRGDEKPMQPVLAPEEGEPVEGPQQTLPPGEEGVSGSLEREGTPSDDRYANTGEDFGYAIILENGEVSLPEEKETPSRRSHSEEGWRRAGERHGGAADRGTVDDMDVGDEHLRAFHRGMRDEEMRRMIEADLWDRDRERRLQADLRDEEVVRRMMEAELREEEIRRMVEDDMGREARRMLGSDMFQPPVNSLALVGEARHGYSATTPPSRPSRSRVKKRGSNSPEIHTLERSAMATGHIEPCEGFSALTFPPTRPKRSKRSKSSPPRVGHEERRKDQLIRDDYLPSDGILEPVNGDVGFPVVESSPLQHRHGWQHDFGPSTRPITDFDEQWLAGIESQIIPDDQPMFSTLPPMRPNRNKQERSIPVMSATLPSRPRREKQKTNRMHEMQQALLGDYPEKFPDAGEHEFIPQDEIIRGDLERADDEAAVLGDTARIWAEETRQFEEGRVVEGEQIGILQDIEIERQGREVNDINENEDVSLEVIVDSIAEDIGGDRHQKQKTPDYAKVVKKTSSKKPARPPPPRSPSSRTKGMPNDKENMKPVNYSYFFTMPRRMPRTYYIIPPMAPPRAYCTIRPRRPPRKVKPRSDSEDIGNLISQVKEHLSQRRHSISECEQVIPLLEDDGDEPMHGESLQGLLSSQLSHKMRGRPLPAPPRPPRTRSMPRGFEVRETADHAQSLETVEAAGAHVEEVCVSTQTDPIPDDMVEESGFPRVSAAAEVEDSEKRRSSASIPDRNIRPQEDSVLPSMFPSFPSRLTVDELEVNRLLVQEVQATKIIVSEIDGMQLQVAELATAGGPLMVTVVPRRPTEPHLQGLEEEEEAEVEAEADAEVEVEEQGSEVEATGKPGSPDVESPDLYFRAEEHHESRL